MEQEEEEGANPNKTSQPSWESRWYTDEEDFRISYMQSPHKDPGKMEKLPGSITYLPCTELYPQLLERTRT